MSGRLRTYSCARGDHDARQRLLVGRAQDVQDLVELVDIVAALEEGAAAEELGEDAPDRPDIDCATVSNPWGTEGGEAGCAQGSTYSLWCSSGNST